MLYRNICKLLGNYLFGLSLAMVIPFFMAIYYQYFEDPKHHPQPHAANAFFWGIFVTLALGFLFYFFGRHATGNLYRREGLISVVLIWVITPAMAGLPFVFGGALTNPFQAYFEAASGFTTTGATCMQAKNYDTATGKEIPITKVVCGEQETVYTFWGNIEPVRDPMNGKVISIGVEAVAKALLFWRSFTQWLGGMGIVVLFVAILPALGVGGKVLFQTEITGPIKDSLTPRIKETAFQLWTIYAGLSFLEIIFLMMTNHELGIFDALTITFSTMSTGGLSPKNESIGFFRNANTDWVVIIFMVLGSINFFLYFYALRGKFYRVYEPEFFLFIIIVILSCSFTAFHLVGQEKLLLNGEDAGPFSIGEAIRHGSFQVISAISTTGFTTVEPKVWPYSIQALMIILMFIGGMSGSTAGGMKIVRVFMLFKIAQHKIELLFRPESVRSFKIGQREVDSNVAITVLVFFWILVSLSVLGAFLYILSGVDLQTAFFLVTIFINNTGFGFQMVSPLDSCAFLTDFGLVLSSLLMLFGRLEFFAVLAVLVPAFWKQNR